MVVNRRLILPIVVVAQFFGTSLWFSTNGVLADLLSFFQLPENALGHLTSAVQFGFICGAFFFAVFTLADRFSPSIVFVISAVLGALLNLGVIWENNTLWSLLLLRFGTGFCLAGIYPIGIKIAADYYDEGLGKSLGYLVGALVLGTAFPHLLVTFEQVLPWKTTIGITSAVALIGGLLLYFFVPNGPYRKPSTAFNFKAIFQVFKHRSFRQAAIGYFGHMWELYAFWAFVPALLVAYNKIHSSANIYVAPWAFVIIGVGSLSCIIAGYVSLIKGPRKTAVTLLMLSGLCCLLSPVFFLYAPPWLFLVFLLFWGMVVIADSPLFSTLVAKNAEAHIKGTAITIVNCIGFAITIVSIQLLQILSKQIPYTYLLLILALGPLVGVLSISKNSSSYYKL